MSKSRVLGVALSLFPLLASGKSYLSIQPVGVPDNSLRVVEVVAIASRDEIVSNRDEIYDPLIASGISDDEIVDGSVVAGIGFCCGRHLASSSKNFFFVPKDVKIEIGDIVEVKSGRVRSRDDAGAVNRATRVRQKKSDGTGSCRWDPPGEELGKILYCDWMPAEGWAKGRQKGHGLADVWIKRE